MDTRRASIILTLSLAAAFAAAAQEDDIFSFIPAGGRTLLEAAEAQGLPQDLATAVASETRDAAGWSDAIAAADLGLMEWEADTLANYLAVRAPFDLSDKPRDGRDLGMALCQSCHIITVVVTQDRTREAWLGTMKSPSHVEIEMTEAERGLLADYLVLNAGIPIDDVPPALRAGGASY